MLIVLFFFNDTATTEIYTLSLHDALPIYRLLEGQARIALALEQLTEIDALDELHHQVLAALVVEVVDHLHHAGVVERGEDRKSTRLNSSHANISYAVFCLKKKK